MGSRTGPGEEGQAVRQGFEPGQLKHTLGDETVAEDDGDDRIDDGRLSRSPENSRHPGTGSENGKRKTSEAAKTQYGSLNDGKVWDEDVGSRQ